MENYKIHLPGGEVHEFTDEPIASKKITFKTPRGADAQEWFEEGSRRQEMRAEVEDSYDYAKIELKSDRPVAIGITGDWHLGSNINYRMLKNDISILAEHPLVAGGLFMGDLTESAFFNPAQDEQTMSWEEQRQWMESIFDFIGKDRILGIWRGNHDSKWQRKTGTCKYNGLSQKYEAPIFYGNSYLDLSVNDINYRMMGSHNMRGNSIYTNTHPAIRGHKETQGLDIVFCGHTHRRGYTNQAIREFNGSRKTHSIVSGTYQKGGEYAKDSGFGTQKEAEQGMWWLILNHDRKIARVQDTDQMLETMSGYL